MLDYVGYIIEIPVTYLLYLSYVAVGRLETTPVACMILLLDSIPGGLSWQTIFQGLGGDITLQATTVSLPHCSALIVLHGGGLSVR